MVTIEQRVTQLERTGDGTLEVLKAQGEALARLDAKIDIRFDALANDISTVREDVARLDAKTDALAGDLARLDAKTDALAEDLARLDAKTDARFDGMANDILAVKEDVVWIRQKLGSNDLS